MELYWLVVSTPLKNMSQLGLLFPIYGPLKNVPNHQPDMMTHAGTIGNLPQTDPWVISNDSPEPVVGHAQNSIKQEKNRWLRVRSCQANPATFQGCPHLYPPAFIMDVDWTKLKTSAFLDWVLPLQVLFFLAILRPNPLEPRSWPWHLASRMGWASDLYIAGFVQPRKARMNRVSTFFFRDTWSQLKWEIIRIHNELNRSH